MKDHIAKIIIAKDGFPLEQIKGRFITNFFRRLFLGSYRVCEVCWREREKEEYKRLLTNKAPTAL